MKGAWPTSFRGRAAWAVETRSRHSYAVAGQQRRRFITDPPHGKLRARRRHVQLLERLKFPGNAANGAGELIDAAEEAVVARKRFPGAKDVNDYGKLLQAVFEEGYRVLKPGRAMVLTLNNREPRAWSALLVAALRAGFQVPHGGVHFQPGVENYRHTARTRRAGSVHGDFVFTFVKPSQATQQPTRESRRSCSCPARSRRDSTTWSRAAR